MRIETYRHSVVDGWSQPFDTALDSADTLVLAFGGSTLLDNPAPIAELASAYPGAIMMGCSTSGEILGTRIDDDTVAVAVTRFDRSRIRKALARLDDNTSSYDAGTKLADQLTADDLRAVFVLSDGLSVNGSDLVRGINDRVSDQVVVTGGLAGDGDRFARTWVIADRAPASLHVTAIGFYGDHIRVGHGSKGGWDIFGPERKVTRSEANVLYELDGKPALNLYKEYLGELAAGLPATGLRFPLALRENRDAEKQLVRTILAVDEDQQSMTFAGDIPQGWMAQLMRANFDQLVEGAENAALMTANRGEDAIPEGEPMLAVAISCVGRRMVLGEGSEEEIEATQAIFPDNTRQIGFYSYGELSPYATGTCDLHNQTMTLTTFHEV
ncbi:MAG: FIST C-terminal domain-containing protein [Gammaproteobacteria bacterium]|nr:FIST C-terminal domain-containing protein [Gammaproteobacteria bacterium]MCP5135756.1 FIST C-terminal domain-containing protein [Gammaproteobacteria bacterium]